MSDVIGDVSHLTDTVIEFSAVHTCIGSSGNGSFALSESKGFKHLVDPRASAKILGDTVRFQVVGPADPTHATTAYACVIPATAPAIPRTPGEILTVGGAAFSQHSLFVTPTPVALGFSQEVAHVIKPEPLVGRPPKVVYYYSVSGGTKDSVVHVLITGKLSVSGIGFVQSW